MRPGSLSTNALWAALLIAVAAAPAAAQTFVTAAPRVELSSGLSGAVGGGPLLDTGLRVNLTRTVGVGLTLAWAGSSGGYVIDARWTPPGLSGRVQPFVTIGAVGTFKFQSSPGSQQYLGTTGDTIVYAPFHDLEISGLQSGAVGAGVRIPIAKHAALEVIGQVWIGQFKPSPAFIGSVRLTISIGQVGR